MGNDDDLEDKLQEVEQELFKETVPESEEGMDSSEIKWLLIQYGVAILALIGSVVFVWILFGDVITEGIQEIIERIEEAREILDENPTV